MGAEERDSRQRKGKVLVNMKWGNAKGGMRREKQ